MEKILEEKGGFIPAGGQAAGGASKRQRRPGGAAAKFLVRWKGFDSSHDSWEPAAGIQAGAPIPVAKWVAARAKKSDVKPGVLQIGARVRVKFGSDYHEGTVTALGKAPSKLRQAGGFHDRRFSALFESDGQTWKIVPGEHVYKVV